MKFQVGQQVHHAPSIKPGKPGEPAVMGPIGIVVGITPCDLREGRTPEQFAGLEKSLPVLAAAKQILRVEFESPKQTIEGFDFRFVAANDSGVGA